jgi:hypothetical protein
VSDMIFSPYNLLASSSTHCTQRYQCSKGTSPKNEHDNMSDFFGKKEYPKLKGFADDLRLWFLSTSFWAANASSFTHIDWRKTHHSEVPLVIELHSCVRETTTITLKVTSCAVVGKEQGFEAVLSLCVKLLQLLLLQELLCSPFSSMLLLLLLSWEWC